MLSSGATSMTHWHVPLQLLLLNALCFIPAQVFEQSTTSSLSSAFNCLGGVLDWGGFSRMAFCMNFLGCLSGADPEARLMGLESCLMNLSVYIELGAVLFRCSWRMRRESFGAFETSGLEQDS